MDSEVVNWENGMTRGECFFYITYKPLHSLGLKWDERSRGTGPPQHEG